MLLGGFGLLADGQSVPTGSWRLRKAKDVIKILALARGHRRHRDEVTEALWPERDSVSGLNNLHQALHIARRGLSGAGGQGSRALALFEETGDEAGVALAFGKLGNLAAAGGQQVRGREYLCRSLAVRRELRDQRGIGKTLMSLGRIEVASGQVDAAGELLREAAEIFRVSGDRPATIGALSRLGELQAVRASRGRLPAVRPGPRAGHAAGLPRRVRDTPSDWTAIRAGTEDGGGRARNDRPERICVR